MATIERYRMTYRQITTSQKEEFRRMAERVFVPNETTRDETYRLLPFLNKGNLIKRRVDYETTLAEFLKKEPLVRILDLGCGAGFWAETQAARDPRLAVYGLTAKDYRRPQDRPAVVYRGIDSQTGGPIFATPDGHHLFSGIEFNKTTTIDNQHYFIGDAHEILRILPANFFHLIVSYEACHYLFDPLRVLKQIHRVLAPNGYAFLDSFSPLIFDRHEKQVSDEAIKKMFQGFGQPFHYGKYCPDELHRRHGLAMKKTRARFSLPVSHRTVVSNPLDNTHVITYYLEP